MCECLCLGLSLCAIVQHFKCIWPIINFQLETVCAACPSPSFTFAFAYALNVAHFYNYGYLLIHFNDLMNVCSSLVAMECAPGTLSMDLHGWNTNKHLMNKIKAFTVRYMASSSSARSHIALGLVLYEINTCIPMESLLPRGVHGSPVCVCVCMRARRKKTANESIAEVRWCRTRTATITSTLATKVATQLISA